MANEKDNQKNKTAQDRRSFLKVGGVGLLGALIGSRILLSEKTAFAQAPKPEAVKETDPQAQALGYRIDAKKVDIKKWPKRAGADGAKQFCYNCQFFQASGDPKTAKTAPCQILAGKLVEARGWCNTWTQNPKVQG